MSEQIVSVRIDRGLYEKMKRLDEINWSALIRKSIAQKIEKIESNEFDREKALKATRGMDKIRALNIFKGKRTGTDIIRQWRDKRK